MKNKSPTPIIFLVAIACFALGLFSVWMRSPATAEATPTPQTAFDQQQTTLLLIWVDNLHSENPQLLGTWFMTYRLPAKDIFLLGLPVGSADTSQDLSSLRSRFEYSDSEGLSSNFLAAVQQKTPLTPDQWIVFDQVAFSTFVDYLGGIQFDGGQLHGDQVIGLVTFLSTDSEALLSTQQRIFIALSKQAPSMGVTPDLTPLTRLIPEHVSLSAEISHLLTLTIPLLPMAPETTHIEIYHSVSPE
ncbi:MAG: hypothetical protein JXA25_02950 [Anaerolineales bacterium]|nr:hypothetical protein [Anaerolineales bacterium]